MTEWISVKERLPDLIDDVSYSVLITYRRKCNKCHQSKIHEYISVGFYSDFDNKKCWDLSEPLDNNYFPDTSTMIEVTHWMPLPELPK